MQKYADARLIMRIAYFMLRTHADAAFSFALSLESIGILIT